LSPLLRIAAPAAARYWHRQAGVPFLGNDVSRGRAENQRIGLSGWIAKAPLSPDGDAE
jgi:hypothetical protein